MFSHATKIILRALFARLILYHFIMVLGSLQFDYDDVRQTGLHIRTLICTAQAMVLSLFASIIGFSRWVIHLIKRERHNFDHLAQQSTMHPRQEISVDEFSETSSMSSVAIEDQITAQHIIFTHENLDLYVLYVNLLGAMLWQTFVAFNFATPYSNFCFICGLAVGWFAAQAFHNDRVELQKCCTVRNVCLMLCMNIVFYLASNVILIPDLDTQTLTINTVLTCGTGCCWTFLGSHVYFRGINYNYKSKGILYDAKRALPTFFLTMTISSLYSAPASQQQALMYMSQLSRVALFHLLGIEPVTKTFAIYVMIMSLEKQNTIDLLISIICAWTTQICILTSIDRVNFYLMIVTCTAMCFTHLFTQANDKSETSTRPNEEKEQVHNHMQTPTLTMTLPSDDAIITEA